MLCLGGSERPRHSATREVLLGERYTRARAVGSGGLLEAKRVRCALREPTEAVPGAEGTGAIGWTGNGSGGNRGEALVSRGAILRGRARIRECE